MIGFVKGVVEEIEIDHCLVDNNGMGYRIFMPTKQLQSLSQGTSIKLFTYLSVREDAMQLYGFISKEYYQLFLQLISVSGVGPKVALGVLGMAQPSEFVGAVQKRDYGYLTKLPGIGKKTAERLVLELKDKLGTASELVAEPVVDIVPGDEAAEALMALGYSMVEIASALATIPDREQLTVQAVIRKALQALSRR